MYYIDGEDCEQTNDVEAGEAVEIEGLETGGAEEIEGAEMGQGNAPLAAEDQVCVYMSYGTVYT